MRTDPKTGLVKFNRFDSLAIAWFNRTNTKIRNQENWLKDEAIHFKLLEDARLKAVEENYPPEMINAISAGIQEQTIDFDMLEQVKKELFRQRKKTVYLSLLYFIRQYRELLKFKLETWCQLFAEYHKIKTVTSPPPPVSNIYNFYNMSSRKRMTGMSMTEMPAPIYFPDFASGCPDFEIKTVTPADFYNPGMFKKQFFLDKTNNSKVIRQEPVYYRNTDGYFNLIYQLKGTAFPATELIDAICGFYEKQQFTPFDYELAVPYLTGSLLSGWKKGKYWSQCWNNKSGDIIHIGLKNNTMYRDELKITVSHIPHGDSNQAMDYYHSIHNNTSCDDSSSFPICMYQKFQVFCFPSLRQQLVEYHEHGLLAYLNLVFRVYQ